MAPMFVKDINFAEIEYYVYCDVSIENDQHIRVAYAYVKPYSKGEGKDPLTGQWKINQSTNAAQFVMVQEIERPIGVIKSSLSNSFYVIDHFGIKGTDFNYW